MLKNNSAILPACLLLIYSSGNILVVRCQLLLYLCFYMPLFVKMILLSAYLVLSIVCLASCKDLSI